jgi:hypothetical protein
MPKYFSGFQSINGYECVRNYLAHSPSHFLSNGGVFRKIDFKKHFSPNIDVLPTPESPTNIVCLVI